MNAPSIYIHLPWCVEKCPYCDFNSHKAPAVLPEKKYINALLKDFDYQCIKWQINQPIHSIFIGGGTPSLFSGASIEQLLSTINKKLGFTNNIEITLEANPGAVDRQYFKEYAAAGINRVSLGIQSFNDTNLRLLGRVHSAKQAMRSVEVAMRYFQRINLDLMFALPQQTSAQACEDLTKAIRFNPQHISWYQLTLEPNTLFFRNPPDLPNEDAIEQITEQGLALLNEHRFHRYEISAFSQQGEESRHNLNYWRYGDYMGLGCGAHGKISEKGGDIFRTRHVAAPMAYIEQMDKKKPPMLTKVADDQRPFEFMLNALRLTNGVEKSLTMQWFNLDNIAQIVKVAQEKGLLEISTARFKATPLGLRYLNDLQLLFLP